jgi:hypothetical protein
MNDVVLDLKKYVTPEVANNADLAESLIRRFAQLV